MKRAPWLPPKTSRWNGPPADGAAYGLFAATSTAGRTGLPVCTIGVRTASVPRTPAKPVAIAVTRGARKPLARPSTAFCSWMMVGTRARAAASIGGTVG